MTATATLHAGDGDRPQKMVKVVRTDPHTGKLVRSVVVTGQTTANMAAQPEVRPAGIDEAVDRIAATQQLEPKLVHAVIKVESNYNPLAVSSKGAQGLMQLMPDTARRFGVENVFDPVENIQGGTRYLRYLLDLYNGDYQLALAAYNAGEHAVEKYGTVPPYPETMNFLAQVGRQYQQSAPAVAPPDKPAVPQPVVEQPSGPAHIQELVDPDGSVRYVSR